MVRETVSLYRAKSTLSDLVDRASHGEEIVISKSGRPKAKLVPLEDVRPQRVPGQGRGLWLVSDDFDAPLPDDVLDDFDGGSE
ncbi:MAG: type II toxin-antitoxin system prevent-host-death family antitoxin [Longimicrobiales bacterium]